MVTVSISIACENSRSSSLQARAAFRLVGTASMRSMTFLQVDRRSNEPFSTYFVYCVFYKLILRILRILQIDIAYIAYFTN